LGAGLDFTATDTKGRLKQNTHNPADVLINRPPGKLQAHKTELVEIVGNLLADNPDERDLHECLKRLTNVRARIHPLADDAEFIAIINRILQTTERQADNPGLKQRLIWLYDMLFNCTTKHAVLLTLKHGWWSIDLPTCATQLRSSEKRPAQRLDDIIIVYQEMLQDLTIDGKAIFQMRYASAVGDADEATFGEEPDPLLDDFVVISDDSGSDDEAISAADFDKILGAFEVLEIDEMPATASLRPSSTGPGRYLSRFWSNSSSPASPKKSTEFKP